MKRDIGGFRHIVEKLKTLDVTIKNDWLEIAHLRASLPDHMWERVGLDIPSIVTHAERAIHECDVLVAEVSGQSTFGVGYEVAYALQLKKPVLALVRAEQFAHSYSIGIANKLLTTASYTEENLETILEDFIKDNRISNKDLRFNFVIDSKIYNHLRARSHESGKTKAEFVRDLLEDDMKKHN